VVVCGGGPVNLVSLGHNLNLYRLVTFVVLAVSATGLLATESEAPAMPSFESVALLAIEQVLRDVGYKIEAGKPDPRTGKPFPLILGQTIDKTKLGDASVPAIELSCAAMGTWTIYGKQRNGDEMHLVAELCDRNSELTPKLLASAKQAQVRMIDLLVKNAPKESVLEFAGLEPQREVVGRLEGEYMQIIVVGEGGIAIMPTLILDASTGRHALVLQAFVNNCFARQTSPMCNGQRELLQRIAVRVAEDLPLK